MLDLTPSLQYTVIAALSPSGLGPSGRGEGRPPTYTVYFSVRLSIAAITAACVASHVSAVAGRAQATRREVCVDPIGPPSLAVAAVPAQWRMASGCIG
eukprot:7383927-Prymnesium_polylepis.1